MAAFSLEEMDDVRLHEHCKEVVKEFLQKNISFAMFHLLKEKTSEGETVLTIEPDEEDSGGIGFDREDYRTFCKRLPEDDCRLALVWFHPGRREEYDIEEATCVFVTWCPDIEAENERELRKYVGACMALNMNKYLIRNKSKYKLEVKASCLDELDENEVLEQLEEGRPPTAITGIFTQDDFN